MDGSVNINSKIVLNRIYRMLKDAHDRDIICHWTMDVHQQ